MSSDARKAALKRYKQSSKYNFTSTTVHGKKPVFAAIESYIAELNKDNDDTDIKITKSNYLLYAGLYCVQHDINPFIDVDKTIYK